MTWYNPDPKDYNNSLRNGFLAQLDEDSTVLGWGCDWTDETGCVSVASSHGVLTEASQSDYSLLTIGGYHHHSHFPFAQKSRPQRRAPTPTPTPAVHTVTFVLSDGDNVHWCAQRQRCFGTSFLRTGMNDSRLPRQARDRHREGTTLIKMPAFDRRLHDGWLSEIWTSEFRGKMPLSIGFNPAERDLGQRAYDTNATCHRNGATRQRCSLEPTVCHSGTNS
eukprot:COSAG06_NODE_2041_length_7754_cov_2.476445_2_plen_221_part_00